MSKNIIKIQNTKLFVLQSQPQSTTDNRFYAKQFTNEGDCKRTAQYLATISGKVHEVVNSSTDEIIFTTK